METTPNMKKLTKPSVVFEDRQMIVVNKPAGVLSQPDARENINLLSLVSDYIGQPAFVVHRIDRPASGLIIFGKTQRAANELSAFFRKKTIQKEYLALVEKNKQLAPKGRLEHILKKNGKTNKSYPSPSGKTAILEYEILQTLDHYYLVKVNLKTGRFHQIRAQFAAIGLPIKGDNKYGAKRNNRNRSIHLHAWKIQLPSYPVFTAALPTEDPLWKVVETIIKEKN